MFQLKYDDEDNNYKNRLDNLIIISFIYNILKKTSVFLEHDYSDIQYDKNSILESALKNYYAGIQWKFSEKFIGNLKFGLGIKDLKDANVDDSENLIFQGTVSYVATKKILLGLNLIRTHTETDIIGTEFILLNSVGFSYNHQINERFSGTLGLITKSDLYKGGSWDGYKNESYSAKIAFKYAFNGWLQAKVDYLFDVRKSDFDNSDYKSNIISLGLHIVR